MKYILLALLWIYQHIIARFLDTVLGYKHTCRYAVPCSEYARREITKDGVFVLPRVMRRLLSCQPFATIRA